MPGINLLPQDMRNNEAKEINRLARKTRTLNVAMSGGAKNNSSVASASRPHDSMWSKIFGSKSQPVSQKVSAGQPSFRGSSMDMLAAARKQKINFSSGVKLNHLVKESPWRKPASEPVKTISQSVKEKATPKPVAKEVKRQPIEVLSTTQKGNKYKFRWLSFWGHKNKITPAHISPPGAIPLLSKERLGEVELPKIVITKEKPAPPVKTPAKKKDQSISESDNWLSILKSLFGGHDRGVKLPATADVDLADEPQQKSDKPKASKIDNKTKYSTVPMGDKSRFHINLIPEELAFRKQINRRAQLISVILAIVLPALVTYGAYAVLQLYKNNIDKQIQDKQIVIDRLRIRVAGYKAMKQRNIDLQQKLLVVKGLLDEHIYWTKFFNLLEKYTLDGVYYTNFSADTGGEFSLPAVASSYDEVARQIVALRQATDFVKEVKVDRVSLQSNEVAGITGVGFELKIKLQDGIFKNIVK